MTRIFNELLRVNTLLQHELNIFKEKRLLQQTVKLNKLFKMISKF